MSLVLGRQKDDVIVIDFTKVTPAELADLQSGKEQIRVVVVDIRGDKVRLGVEALKSVKVDREEVWQEKQRDAALAAAGKGAGHG